MFYAATQLDDENADNSWKKVSNAISYIVKHLKPTEDEIVRFYASKTIENITALSIRIGFKFATLDVSTLLLNAFYTTQIEAFKISAGVSISHICKLNDAIFPTLFESITCKKFCNILIDSHPRIQQAFITMLNIELNRGGNKILC